MKPETFIGSETGAALLGALIICVLVMSVLVWYLQWSQIAGKSDTRLATTQHALSYADSGLNAASQRLKSPGLDPDNRNSFTGGASLYNGRYEYSVVMDTDTHSLSDTYATGYFYLAKGDWVDPQNGKVAERAVIHAKIYFAGIQNLVVAVPGRLPVGGGTVVDGTMYAKDLLFNRSAEGKTTRVGMSLYHQSVMDDRNQHNPAPDYVVFNSSPATAEHSEYPLHLPRLGSAFRQFYAAKAGTGSGQLANGASLDGFVGKPGDSPDAVYFCDGDLHIGKSNAFTAQESILIYATGDVYIHKPVMVNIGTWVAFLTEKNIHIAEDAPNDMILKGTYLANGAVLTDGRPRHPGSFHLYGNMIAGRGIDLAENWDTRVYVHAGPMENILALPNFTQLLDYKVLQGKYAR
jgi:hypothetical protein